MKYTNISIPELISKLKQLPDQHKKYTAWLDEQPVTNPGLLHKLKSWWEAINNKSKSRQEQAQDIISSMLKMIDVDPDTVSTEQTEQLVAVVSRLVDIPQPYRQQAAQAVLTRVLKNDKSRPVTTRVIEIIDAVKQVVEDIQEDAQQVEPNVVIVDEQMKPIKQEDTQHVEPNVVIVDEQMKPIKQPEVVQLAGETFFDHKHDIFHILEKVKRENRWLDCDIIDISDKHGALACVAQSLEPGKYRIVINSGTYRFNNVKNNQMMLALHVAECVFRCVLEFTGTKYTLKTLDTLLDQFHDRFVGQFEEPE